MFYTRARLVIVSLMLADGGEESIIESVKFTVIYCNLMFIQILIMFLRSLFIYSGTIILYSRTSIIQTIRASDEELIH